MCCLDNFDSYRDLVVATIYGTEVAAAQPAVVFDHVVVDANVWQAGV